MKRISTACFLAAVVAFTGCIDEQSPVAPEADVAEIATVDGELAAQKGTPYEMDPAVQADIEARLTNYVKQRAAEFEAKRAEAGVQTNFATKTIGYHWTGVLEGETVGSAVFFNDRGNKQIPIQWVPEDPRRGGRTDIGYAYDDEFGFFGNYSVPGVTTDQMFAAIDRAIATWESQPCSKGLSIPKSGFFEWLFFESDVYHEGFFPLAPNVIGVTSIAIFIDPATGVPTDIDSDGNLDYAWSIITYNSLFPWGIDINTFPFVDVESIALHEMGHGLGQAHFGTAFQTLANGKVHFAPRSVMNAAYSGLQQSLTGTDRAGHCSMYGSWPNN